MTDHENISHPLRCGVVGVGYLGRHHARIYHELEGCELVGVLDVNDEAAATACEKYGPFGTASLKDIRQ